MVKAGWLVGWLVGGMGLVLFFVKTPKLD